MLKLSSLQNVVLLQRPFPWQRKSGRGTERRRTGEAHCHKPNSCAASGWCTAMTLLLICCMTCAERTYALMKQELLPSSSTRIIKSPKTQMPSRTVTLAVCLLLFPNTPQDPQDIPQDTFLSTKGLGGKDQLGHLVHPSPWRYLLQLPYSSAAWERFPLTQWVFHLSKA